jgi:hypothetical protein
MALWYCAASTPGTYFFCGIGPLLCQVTSGARGCSEVRKVARAERIYCRASSKEKRKRLFVLLLSPPQHFYATNLQRKGKCSRQKMLPREACGGRGLCANGSTRRRNGDAKVSEIHFTIVRRPRLITFRSNGRSRDSLCVLCVYVASRR